MEKEVLINKGLLALRKKTEARKQQTAIAKHAVEMTEGEFSQSDLIKLKDFFYYKGNYGDNIFDFQEQKYPDRISIALKSMKDLIELFKKIGYTEFIEDYFKSLEKMYGIKVTFEKGNEERNDEIINLVKEMSDCQKDICHYADEIKIHLAFEAEQIDFVKKPDFVDIIDLKSLFKKNDAKKAQRKGQRLSERLKLKNEAVSEIISNG